MSSRNFLMLSLCPSQSPLNVRKIHNSTIHVYRVGAPITNHLRDSTLNLEKYKVVQNFPM